MRHLIYFERYAWKERLFPDYIPRTELGLIVVIPAFKEENLLDALDALNRCQPPEQEVLIIVVLNESEVDSEKTKEINLATSDQLAKYQSKYDLLFEKVSLPKKKAGVGLARKIGMDEAASIFNKQQKDGIIICYDADCSCAANYLIEIERAFHGNEKKAGIIFYEHRLDGENQAEIINYELYLRYYIDGLRYAGFPYAHHTLGSCIVIKSETYQKAGGMNSRKAGEDFYFLNKVIPLGGFQELNTTSVYPSARISDRVPFGTGMAVSSLVKSKEYRVYHPKVFEVLKTFFAQLPNFQKQEFAQTPIPIQHFLGSAWEAEILRVKQSVAGYEKFQTHFYKWFDAFKVLKFVHYYRDNHRQNIPIEEAVSWLFDTLGIKEPETKMEKMKCLRTFDRSLDQIK